MSLVDFPSAEHEDAAEHVVGRDVVIPRPPMALRYEQEQPPEGRPEPDVEGDLRFSLPVFARVEVLPPDASSECFMIATWNKRAFGQGGDGLTAYGCGNRTDFTFRTRVFDSFPEVIRHNVVKLRPGEWNEMVLALAEHQATYWINRVPVASCIIHDGDLPSRELYFGLTRYGGRAYSFRRFDVSRDPSVLSVFRDHVVTVHCAAGEGGSVWMRCLRMSGEEVARFEAAGASALLPGTEVVALRDIAAHPCREQEDGRTIYDGSKTVWVRRGTSGRVRRHFGSDCGHASDAVSLEVSGVRAWLKGGSYVFVPPGEADSLRAQGEERLGEFRQRVAGVMGVLPHSLKLALPDGRFLASSEDAQSLRSLLRAPGAGGDDASLGPGAAAAR